MTSTVDLAEQLSAEDHTQALQAELWATQAQVAVLQAKIVVLEEKLHDPRKVSARVLLDYVQRILPLYSSLRIDDRLLRPINPNLEVLMRHKDVRSCNFSLGRQQVVVEVNDTRLQTQEQTEAFTRELCDLVPMSKAQDFELVSIDSRTRRVTVNQ
jgi:hypothetical protein